MFKVFLRELRRLATTPIYWLCMIIGPAFCVIFFTTLMAEGLPSTMPIGLVDADNSATTRNLARNLDAFQNSEIVAKFASVTEARQAMQRGEIYAFYYIPHGTTHEMLLQHAPKVSFYMNSQFFVAGSLTYKDMRMMSELMAGAASRSVLRAKGATDGQMTPYLQPIVVDSHPIHNPSLNYSVYLSNVIVPGLLGLFIFFVTVFGIGSEIKEDTSDELLATAAKGGSNSRTETAYKALFGKILAQSLIFLLVGCTIVLYFYGYLKFPCYCGIPTMLGVMALFVLACQGLGVLMICSLPSPRMGLSFASLWGVMSFSICGMSFPVMAMPSWIQGLSTLFPLRHYFLLYVNCALDGYAFINAWPYTLALLVFALLPFLFAPRFGKIMRNTAYAA